MVSHNFHALNNMLTSNDLQLRTWAMIGQNQQLVTDEPVEFEK